ncbi:hypothetical protein Rhal01_03403 [Rubritalea halochordaticola]|uniref:Uncharacterized protein n=1 Tax=Rubritalea halochordaticola TaxID=714537 RepID=A0ABP9V5F0_9BACT
MCSSKDQVISEFEQLVSRILEADDDNRSLIISLLQQKDYRRAFITWDKITTDRKIILSVADKKVDENFYWSFLY